MEHKVVPKPSGPGLIEVEIIPLSLHSCNPIQPQNDRKQFAYPGGGGSVPVYLPEALGKQLPMFQRFRARVIAEAHLPQDQYETSPTASLR